MDLWFSEFHTPDVKLSIKVTRHIFCAESEHQKIDVFESPEFGRILVMDGRLALTEKDEFIYHEMITHPAMAVHSAVKSVLVIGAGNGGVLKELCKYPTIESIDIAEIDPMTIDVAKRFFPATSGSFDDGRVTLFLQDELKYIRKCEDKYDLIIVDSTDPFGTAEGLFTKEFYGNCYKALKNDGILINQHETPFYEKSAKAVAKAHKHIYKSFEFCKIYQSHMPTYPSGHWLFGFASKKFHPLHDLQEQSWREKEIHTRYYNINLHKGAFYLPNYVTEMLENVE